jgi:hypothetical protein
MALEQIAQKQMNQVERERSLNITIDSEGRTIDKRTGEVIQLQTRMPTLKANLKVQRRDFKSGIASTLPGEQSSGIESIIPGSKRPFSSVTEQSEHKDDEAESNANDNFFDPRLK